MRACTFTAGKRSGAVKPLTRFCKCFAQLETTVRKVLRALWHISDSETHQARPQRHCRQNRKSSYTRLPFFPRCLIALVCGSAVCLWTQMGKRQSSHSACSRGDSVRGLSWVLRLTCVTRCVQLYRRASLISRCCLRRLSHHCARRRRSRLPSCRLCRSQRRLCTLRTGVRRQIHCSHLCSLKMTSPSRGASCRR